MYQKHIYTHIQNWLLQRFELQQPFCYFNLSIPPPTARLFFKKIIRLLLNYEGIHFDFRKAGQEKVPVCLYFVQIVTYIF